MRLKTIGKRGAGLLLSALLALSLCLPVSAAGGAGYTDLRGHWAESQLQWAVEQGYLTGTSATTLSPNKTLTRGMAAVILYRYAGSPTAGENSRFSDVPAGAYYAKAVAWVDQAGLMSGRGNGRFAPQANMTREEFLTVLYRLRVQTYGVPEQVGKTTGSRWQIMVTRIPSVPTPGRVWPGRWATCSWLTAARPISSVPEML